ncbi:MAG: ATP-dependent DNA helicase [Alphaproteobacteria bacterium]
MAGFRSALWVTSDGEARRVARGEAADLVRQSPPLLACMPAVARRLGLPPFRSFDLLELFAFVRPAQFCLPTPRGLATALGLPRPRSPEGEAEILMAAARVLLQEQAGSVDDRNALPIARAMAGGGWIWGAPLLRVLDAAQADATASIQRALAVWDRLPAWQEEAPPTPPASHPVSVVEARQRLASLLGRDAEPRPSQADFASAAAGAFHPRERRDQPHFVLAEAGTGVGKTLGYIAPASVWAEKNEAPVWVSTYTRNLQHQVDAELRRLFPNEAERRSKVVIRKGRENYLCLLNLEDAVRAMPARPGDAVALGLMVRWTERSRDGDMVGGDFPAWLPDLIGGGRTRGLADRRGECIYAACPHYQKCFIERSVRRARRAEIVVANHALVLAQAALGGLDDSVLPTRYVFDEGHHLFDAADSAFSAALSGFETAELRRWLLGAEGGRSRARGLRRRMEDLAADEDTADALEQAIRAAAVLPAEGWLARLAEDRPHGPVEAFLVLVRRQVQARAAGPEAAYGIECDLEPPADGLREAAAVLAAAFDRLLVPVAALRRRLLQRLEDEADALETATRLRIEGLCRSLQRRAEVQVTAWRAMLAAIGARPDDRFVDWLAIDRVDGRDTDVGMHRHWVDPTLPFVEAVGGHAHGILVTSATLRDATGEAEADWLAAEARTGAVHLSAPATRAAVPSPFDYARQTRVIVVTDVRKDDLGQVAAAYRALFLAAGGGGLGLFTAIGRLRAVHERIAAALEAEGRMLLAQHVDRMDVNTLIEIFRAEADSCLLGTDAVRDGVDVPGRALRLIVFDRVPWPRPDILHRARRARFGGRAYDDRITRLRLRQAFGRLVRRAGDTGVFVLLDPMMPSRLAGAFPDGVAVERMGLAAAVEATRGFITDRASAADITGLLLDLPDGAA